MNTGFLSRLGSAVTKLLLLFVIALLSGCATHSSIKDGRRLSEKQGLVVMEINSDSYYLLDYVKYKSAQGFGDFLATEMGASEGRLYVEPGDKYWVLPVNEGDYMWGHVSNGPRFTNIGTSNKFSVKAGEITYIGRVDVASEGNQFKIHVTDHEDDFRHYLADTYPSYLKTMAVRKQVMRIGY